MKPAPRRGLPIFEAAVQVFSEKGFANTSIDEVAQRAGVAKGTIYYNYRSKKGLFVALIEEGIERLEKVINRELARRDEVIAQLQAVITAHFSFFDEHRDYCRLLLSEVWGLGHRWEKQVERLRTGPIRAIRNVLERGQAAGVIRRDIEVESAAVALFGAVAVTALNWVLFQGRSRFDEVAHTLKGIFLRGCQAHAADKGKETPVNGWEPAARPVGV